MNKIEILLWIIFATQVLIAKWILQLDYYVRLKKGVDKE